ncbi:sporulation histidine kinase inhibitor Sda [Bacillus suaedae]|uniref:Sporulation histidine kinase inhibitor Sda n=1 Tax=Halalkalibacter suaedae TaxID=2822140 RepID=A0A940WQD2_9BACI|nr:sporulation histidine kinase inhibitor Sda [Bacillus suaedae]MBP3950416.1 sporulation histidine kinase inhibitor Sda [Bacillus suaedae]
MENHSKSTFWEISNDDLLGIYEKAICVEEISPHFIDLLVDELERRKIAIQVSKSSMP